MEFVDKIYIISLEKDEKRRKYLQKVKKDVRKDLKFEI